MRLTLFYFLGWITLLSLSMTSCKSIEPITPNKPEDNQTKYEALDINDMTHSIMFQDLKNDERVITGKLPNGVTYYIMPNQKPEKRAELRLVVKAGSIDEDNDQLGLAHFIEHMAFNGTRNFEKNELVDYLETVGLQFGPDLNAYTSFDETVYMLQVRTDVEEQLKKGFLVLSDWASGLKFDEAEIEKERGVVISEWRSRLSAAQRMQQEYLPVLLKGSRYARRLPIGDPDVIQNADHQTIKRFYYDWYRPELMAVVAVGDFNPNLIEDYISEYFDKVPKAIQPRTKRSFGIGTHENTLVKICNDAEATMTQVRVINKMPEKVVRNVDDFKERVTSSLFVRLMNERLKELSRQPDAPYIFSSSYYGRDIGPMDTYSSFAVCQEGEVLGALSAIVRENLRIKEYGFTQAELERSKAAMISSAETVLIEGDKTESSKLARQYLKHFLESAPYLSPKAYHDLVQKYVPVITLDEVNQRSEWFTKDNRVVIITAPENETVNLPTNSEVLSVFEQVEEEKLEDYSETIQEGPLLDAKIGPIEIDQQSIDSLTGIESILLKNGRRVFIKATDFNNDEINLKALIQGGSSSVSEENSMAAKHAAWVINDSGLGNFSSQDLSKKLAGKKVRASAFVSYANHGVSGSCGSEESELLAQMTHLFLINSRKDTSAFHSFVEKLSAYYANLMSDPSYYFYNEVIRISSGGNERLLVPNSEQIQKLDFSEIHRVYKEMFCHDEPTDIIIIGNIDSGIKQTFLRYFSALPDVTNNRSEVKTLDYFPAPGEYVWKKGKAPKSYVECQYICTDSLLTAQKIEDIKLLKRVVDIRLREALREDKGGVYGVSTFIKTKSLPENKYIFGFRFNCAPEKVSELLSEAKEVLKGLTGSPCEDGILVKVTEIERQRFKKVSQTNQFWMDIISESVQENLDFSWFTESQLEIRLSNFNAQKLLELSDQTFNAAELAVYIQNPE